MRAADSPDGKSAPRSNESGEFLDAPRELRQLAQRSKALKITHRRVFGSELDFPLLNGRFGGSGVRVASGSKIAPTVRDVLLAEGANCEPRMADGKHGKSISESAFVAHDSGAAADSASEPFAESTSETERDALNLPLLVCHRETVELRFKQKGRSVYVDAGIAFAYASKSVAISLTTRSQAFHTQHPDTTLVFGVTHVQREKFVVVSLSLFGGVLYTSSKVKHITLPFPNGCARQCVATAYLPTTTCNKFVSLLCAQNFENFDELDRQKVFNIDVSDAKNLPFADLVVMQVPAATVRLRVLRGENPLIKPGYEIVAWTPGIQFDKSRVLSRISVAPEQSEGHIWLARFK